MTINSPNGQKTIWKKPWRNAANNYSGSTILWLEKVQQFILYSPIFLQ